MTIVYDVHIHNTQQHLQNSYTQLLEFELKTSWGHANVFAI
jgi:hypothetical protein